MKMASSQVEIVKSPTFVSVPRNQNRQEICRDNNVRAAQAVFEKNLKVLVRDHFGNCCRPVDSDNNLNDQGNNGDHNNNFKRIEDCDSLSKHRVLDRCPGKTGESEKQNQESQNLPKESNSEKLSINGNSSDDNPENLHPAEAKNGSRNEILAASSLVQMWEARLHQPNTDPSQTQSCNSRTGSGWSISENPGFNSSNEEISKESETIQRVDKENNTNNNYINNGDETDWDSQLDINWVCDSTEKERVNSVSDSTDKERVRIVDIIRRLKFDPDKTSNNNNASEQAVIPCTPRIRGRQALADLLLQMERSRQKELDSVEERHAVSKFTQRGRLQSMLKIRCLERCVAIQDRHRSKSAAADVNPCSLIHLREKLKGSMVNGTAGQTNGIYAKNPEESGSSNLETSASEQPRTFQSNDTDADNAETSCLGAQERQEESFLCPQETAGKFVFQEKADKNFSQKAREMVTSRGIEKKDISRKTAGESNSRRAAVKSKTNPQQAEEKVIFQEHGEKAAYGETSEKAAFQENGKEDAFRENGEKAGSRETSEKGVSRETGEKAVLREDSQKAILLEAAVKTIGRENVEKAMLKAAEKATPRETAEKMIFRESAEKIDSRRYTERSDSRQTAEKTSVREIAEKTSAGETSEKTIAWETAEKSDSKKNPGRTTAEKSDSCETAGKTIFEDREKNVSRGTVEKTIFQKFTDKSASRKTGEKIITRETAEKNVARQKSEKTIAQETAEQCGSKNNAGKNFFQETTEKSGPTQSAEKTISQETADENASKQTSRIFIDKSISRKTTDTQETRTATGSCNNSTEKELPKLEEKIVDETAANDELGKTERSENQRKASEENARGTNSWNPDEIIQTAEEPKPLFELEGEESENQRRRRWFLDDEETEFLNDWDENEIIEEEEEEYGHDPNYGYAENANDWFNEISRPRSHWEDLRKQWYLQVLNTDSEKDEIRQLLQRQSVSNFLASDLRDKIDQLMISRPQRRVDIEQEQGQEQDQDQDQDQEQEHEQDHHQEQWEETETNQEQDRERAREGTPAFSEQYHEAASDGLSQSSSSLMSAPSLMRSWSYHDQDQEVGDDHDRVTSASPAAQSRRSSFPTNHASAEMELMICDLRGQMEQLQREMLELRSSMKSCIDMQFHLQRSISQDSRSVQSGGSESKFKLKCCVCREMPVDSLLYRCGHMCTCLKCAHELQWSSGKCPKCLAPIVDVVRAFLDS